MALYADAETGCCPRFDPQPWDNKVVQWKDKLFLRDRVISLFHIPLNYGAVMIKNIEKIQNAGALAGKPLMLSDETSPWGADVYIHTSKPVPGARMEAISGTFLSAVFEGPFQNISTWVRRMYALADSKKKTIHKLFFYYTTCPACAKAYGKNYVVLIGRIS